MAHNDRVDLAHEGKDVGIGIANVGLQREPYVFWRKRLAIDTRDAAENLCASVPLSNHRQERRALRKRDDDGQTDHRGHRDEGEETPPIVIPRIAHVRHVDLQADSADEIADGAEECDSEEHLGAPNAGHGLHRQDRARGAAHGRRHTPKEAEPQDHRRPRSQRQHRGGDHRPGDHDVGDDQGSLAAIVIAQWPRQAHAHGRARHVQGRERFARPVRELESLRQSSVHWCRSPHLNAFGKRRAPHSHQDQERIGPGTDRIHVCRHRRAGEALYIQQHRATMATGSSLVR
mmetsp:Transcript_48778/g.136510  ORF Transcript_48778/g.136510 Transcript_48778/m.136510 type:complete len:289 (+) Transcript_48778:1249-2115(+)